MYRIFSHFSLRARLQLIVAGLSLLALGLISLMASTSQTALLNDKRELLHNSAKSLMDKIDRNLFERYGDVQAFALSEPARSGDRQRIERFMADMMAAYAPIYDMMMVTDKSGKTIAVNHVDKSGKKIDSDKILSKNFSGSTWFKMSISGEIKPGSAFFSDVEFDRDDAEIAGTDGREIVFAAPIRHPTSGEILGVWSNKMSWRDVIETISKEGTAALINERLANLSISILDNEGKYLMPPKDPDFKGEALREHFGNLISRMENDRLVVDSELANGEKRIEALAKSKGYSAYPGRGWIMSLHAPALDSQLLFNRRLIAIAIVFIFFVNLICAWLVRRTSIEFETQLSFLGLDAEKLNRTSTTILHASQSLTSAVSAEASAINETVTGSEEMSSMLAQTAQQASRSLQVADDGRMESSKGRAVVIRLVNAMDEIHQSNEKLDGLIKFTENIRTKTLVINDIVSETRLLSFNASIEAARAGAHGKGFAVVAEEIGKLAAMSGRAADEIRQLLESSSNEVNAIVRSTQERVQAGRQASEACESTFSEMGKILEKITESVKMIDSATRDQHAGITQTNRAMNEMERVTHSNSQSAETLAGQAHALSQGSDSVHKSILTLRNLVFGSRDAQKRITTAKVPLQVSALPGSLEHPDSPNKKTA
jgi:hypothetical protein